MYFASDNTAGVLPEILDAVSTAMTGFAPSYSTDRLTEQVTEDLSDLFEREVHVFMTPTGTAANALSMAALTPPWGVIFAHRAAHLMADECGAAEFFTGGAKLVGVDGDGAKMTLDHLAAALDGHPPHPPHGGRITTFSLTQATECGQVYTVDEVTALASLAKSHGLSVHMDGARFSNAVAALGCKPADMTWKAGVDVLSFGATKNGCMAAEAIVVFDKVKADELSFRRMKAGHLLSKSRFMAAQLIAYLEDDLWLQSAGRANDMAARLSKGIADGGVGRIAWATEANEVFTIIPKSAESRLIAAGATFNEWTFPGPAGDPIGPDEVLVRLVASFATTEAHVDDFLTVLNAKS